MKDFLSYIAESMIEYKPEVNPKIEFKLDKTLFGYYCEKDSGYYNVHACQDTNLEILSYELLS